MAPESTALPTIKKNQQTPMETTKSSVAVHSKGDAKQSSPMKKERRGELPHYMRPTAESAAKQQPVTKEESDGSQTAYDEAVDKEGESTASQDGTCQAHAITSL